MESDAGLPAAESVDRVNQEFDPLLALQFLTDNNVRFVLIGGYAASLRGSPVITGDLDICYARDADNLERLAAALRELDARPRGVDEDVPFLLDARTLRLGDTFTFVTRAGSVDCFGTPSGTAGFVDLAADATEEDLNGLTVSVASLDDLIRMKRASGRRKDQIQLEWLAAIKQELEGGKEPGPG
jgi:hypothetical protein